MKIHLNLFATLACYKPPAHGSGPLLIECEDHTSIGQVLAKLGVPHDKVKLYFRNGVHAKKDTILQDGDRVGVFPPIGGG